MTCLPSPRLSAAASLLLALFVAMDTAGAQTASPVAAPVTPPSGVALAPPDAEQAAAFERAMEEYRRQHFASAYGRFVALADQGHAESARLAWMMYRYGSKLYGADWYASAPQLDAWTVLLVGAPRHPPAFEPQ